MKINRQKPLTTIQIAAQKTLKDLKKCDDHIQVIDAFIGTVKKCGTREEKILASCLEEAVTDFHVTPQAAYIIETTALKSMVSGIEGPIARVLVKAGLEAMEKLSHDTEPAFWIGRTFMEGLSRVAGTEKEKNFAATVEDAVLKGVSNDAIPNYKALKYGFEMLNEDSDLKQNEMMAEYGLKITDPDSGISTDEVYGMSCAVLGGIARNSGKKDKNMINRMVDIGSKFRTLYDNPNESLNVQREAFKIIAGKEDLW